MIADWRIMRVRDLIAAGALHVSDGYRVTNRELGPEGVPFVRGGDIGGSGKINHAVDDHIRPEFYERITNKLTRPGDVAFITKGTVGRVGFVRDDQPPMVFAPQVCYWRVLDTDQLDPRFVFYLLSGVEFQANLDAVKTHGSMLADYVSIADQQTFGLTVPSIGAQRAIGEILGAIDDKIELNHQTSSTLEKLARSVFQHSFGSRDTPLPIGWDLRPLGDGIALVRGASYKSEDLAASDVALVTLKSFQRGGGYREDGLKSFTGKYKNEQICAPGDLVVAFTDVTQAADVIGRPALVSPQSRFQTLVASQDVAIVRPCDPRLTVPYLYCLMLTDDFVAHAKGHANGSTVLHLHRDGILRYACLWPSEESASAFSRFAEPLFTAKQRLVMENDVLARTRDLLAPRLLAGKLRIRDAEERVAAVA